MNGDNAAYFHSFGVKKLKKNQKKLKIHSDKNITTNIYRMQAYDSVMCGIF